MNVKESLPDDSYIELLDETDQTQTKDANFKPAFYVPLKNQEAFEGEDVILECVIVANPEPEVIWYRNNVPVKESKLLTIKWPKLPSVKNYWNGNPLLYLSNAIGHEGENSLLSELIRQDLAVSVMAGPSSRL